MTALRLPERLSTRIALGLGALFAVLSVAVAVCGVALAWSYGAWRKSAELAAAERHAVAIGVAAREQYMHDSHGALLRDATHLGHEHEWAAKLATHLDALRPMVSQAEQKQLDEIHTESRTLSRIFTEEIFPAALSGDDVKMHAAHGKAETHLDAMIATSDAAVADLSTRSRLGAERAASAARRLATCAVVCVVVAGLFAAFLAIGFVRSIGRPVAALGEAAARIGRGDFDADLPPFETKELEGLRLDLRRMADELRDRERRLVQAERLAAVGTLAAGVAHELNTPLGVILGYLKRLRRDDRLASAGDELRILDEEANQCQRIVADLVTFAREPQLEMVRLDLAGLVRETVERAQSEHHEVAVDAPHEIRVRADATRIAQVVRNLVANATAASPEDTPVSVAVEDGADACIVVRDRGVGIAAADLPRVFEPFFSRRSGGTGLGLAICHGIVHAHGGRIELASEVGKGTEVRVHLPKDRGGEG